MEQVRYSEFSLKLHNAGVAARIPLNGSIEVTRRCPLRCVHCYNNLPAQDRRARSAELTYDEHCRILDELADAGCLWLLYTGGEIFLRNDFLRMYTYAKKKGMLVTLFTNGVLVTQSIADYLAEYSPFIIEITLYGSTRETYERVTGVAGSYERCLRGIELLRNRNLPLRLKTVVLTINKHELEGTKAMARNLGLEFRYDAMINPRLDQCLAPLSVRLPPEEAVRIDLGDEKVRAEWQKYAERFKGPVHAPERWDDLFHCGAGMSSFSIDPYGNLQSCGFLKGDMWNLRQGSFRAGWDGLVRETRNKKITRRTKCTSCEIKALCGMCPALGKLENGDAEEPVEYLCRAAHQRTRALGTEVPSHGDCAYCEAGGMA